MDGRAGGPEDPFRTRVPDEGARRPPQPAGGYSAPGYPQQSAPGYPQQSAPGYPQQSAPGYPQQSAPGYPQQSAPGFSPTWPAAPAQPPAPQQRSAPPPQTQLDPLAAPIGADDDGTLADHEVDEVAEDAPHHAGPRTRLLLALSLATALVGLLGAGLVWTRLRAERAADHERAQAEQRALAERAAAETRVEELRARMRALVRGRLEDGYGRLRVGRPIPAASSFLGAVELLDDFLAGRGRFAEALAPALKTLERSSLPEGQEDVALRAAARRALRVVVGTSGYRRALARGPWACAFGAEPERVFGLDGQSLRAFDAREGRELGGPRDLPLRGNLTGFARAPDGKSLFAVTPEELVLVELPADPAGQPRVRWRRRDPGRLQAAASPDGRLLANGARVSVGNQVHEVVEVRDPSDGRVLLTLDSATRAQTLNYPASAEALAFAPNSQALAVGYGDGTLGLWALQGPSHAAAAVLPAAGGRRSARALQFTPEGRLVVGDDLGALWLWTPGQALGPQLQRDQQTPVRALAWAPGRRLLCVGHEDGRVDVWALSPLDQGVSGEVPAVKLRTLHQQGQVASLAVSPDDQLLVSATLGGDPPRVWRLDPLRTYAGGGPVALSAHGERLAWLASLYHGLDQVVLHGPGGERRIDLGDRRFYRRVRQGLSFSPRGGLLVVPINPHPQANERRRVEVWRVDQDPPQRAGQVACQAPGPVLALDEERFLVGRLHEERLGDSGLIHRALLARDEPVAELRWHGAAVLALASAAERLASASVDGTAALWSLRARRRTPEVLFLPDRQLDLRERIGPEPSEDEWRARFAELVGRAPGSDPSTKAWASAVALDASGERVAIGYGDGAVHVWDAGAPDAVPARLYGHTGRVVGAAFLDRDLLATAAGDGRLVLWDARERRELAAFALGSSATHFAAEGDRLLVSTAAQLVWELDLDLPADVPLDQAKLEARLPVEPRVWR
ncbi:MAG: hypothetical protein AB7N76_32735 [Planctomycetota bacterium]